MPRRNHAGVVLSLAAALSVAACGSSSNAPAAASAADGIAFAGCMLSHGVANYPDPTFHDGRPIEQPPNAYGINPDAPAVQGAEKACGGDESPGV